MMRLRYNCQKAHPIVPCMAKLETIRARVEPDIKLRFSELAKQQGLSESELLRSIVLDLTNQGTPAVQSIKIDTEHLELERLSIRLPRFLMQAAKQNAKTKGMAISRWVSALVQANLTGQPIMTTEEIIVLQASNRELTAIGRNINQIAKVLNESFYRVEQVKMETLNELMQVINTNQAAIRALIRVS